MVNDEDRRRLLETRHDIHAAADETSITPSAPQQAAVSASRIELADRREALRNAAGTVEREKSETDAERQRLDRESAAMVRRYGFIRSKVEDALLNVDPTAPLDPNEALRRQRLFARVFGRTVSDMEALGAGNRIEALGTVVTSLQSEVDLAPMGHAPSLAEAHAKVVAAAEAMAREGDEDTQAMMALRGARAALDQSAAAHALLVESALVREGRREELGRFVLARDAAYAARRKAKTPIGTEEGIEAVDAEPPVHIQPVVEAAPAAPAGG